MATIVYNSAKKALLDGGIDMANDTIKVALVTSGYTPDMDTHVFFDDITNEVSGTGYSAGGETLSGKSVTQDDDADESYLTASNTIWEGSSITARGAVMYKSTGVGSTSPLIAYFDFGQDETTVADTFRLTWPEGGLFVLASA